MCVLRAAVVLALLSVVLVGLGGVFVFLVFFFAAVVLVFAVLCLLWVLGLSAPRCPAGLGPCAARLVPGLIP